ncbi:MAG: DUF664 domain-containing protein [Gemmatimonadetes bacterium]|nr:DUF664 domain-containing protein [Gemmatimonadota bacterium]
MEPRVEGLAAIFDLNTDLLLNCTADLSDAQAGARLERGGNSIVFLVAHLTDARHFLADLLGQPLPNPLTPMLADVNSIEDVVDMPTLGELLGAWRRVSAHVAGILGGLSAADVDAAAAHPFPVPGRRRLDALAFLPTTRATMWARWRSSGASSGSRR